MFSKAVFTFIVGVLSVNALTIPVARSPAPEPESQELEAWILRRDLSHELFSREPEDRPQWAKRETHRHRSKPHHRELQALDELFSREPEDQPQWTKREPRGGGGGGGSKSHTGGGGGTHDSSKQTAKPDPKAKVQSDKDKKKGK